MINLDYTFADKYTLSSFTINADVTDPDTGAATDPTTVTISIKDPGGVLDVDAVSMVKDDTGDYHYDYDIPATIGAYVGRTKCISADDRVTIKTFGFWAEASI